MEGKGVLFPGRRAVLGLIVFVFTSIFAHLPAFAANVTIQWDPSPDSTVTGYNFYHGVASRTYTNILNVGNATTVTVSNLVVGTTYYFAATAYNALGTESVFSDELVYTIPSSPNVPPTLNAIGSVTLSEDAAGQTVNLAGIGSGSASETQTLTVTATSSNPGLIPNPTVNYTSPNPTGSLNLTPVANANGSATITVTVNDGGAQNSTITRTFTVTVNAVNDQPTLAPLNNLTLNEDAPAQVVNLSGIGTGAANETQTLTITATSSSPGLLPNPTVSYTSPNATGTLTFTPVANANGTATITVTVNDGQTQNNTQVRTFTVTVNAVNDAPTVNSIANLSLNENAGLQTVSLGGIGSGAANETQTLTITAVSSNPALIPNPTVSYTSPNTTGTLTFTPAPGSTGSATVTVTVNDGQAQNNTFSRTFTVAVNDINDPPTLNAIGNLTLNEDAGLQTVNLAGISSGAANESQTLTVTATSSNPTLIPNPVVNYSSPNATGTLTLSPAANASGNATITVTVNDGQPQNNTVTRTFAVAVTAVNDAPTLNPLSNVTLNEDAGAQTVNLSGIGTGAPNETQALSVTATSSNPGLIPNPTLTYTSPNAAGSLSFTPAPDANGTATITVTVNDGQAQNNTFSRTFTVTINAVNDAPTLNSIGNRILTEDAGIQTVNLSGISAGPAGESQPLTITATSSNPGLIPNPTVTYTSPSTTGTLTFTPVANTSGGATITVTITDGQALNNTLTRTFTVTVNAVNDPPTLDNLNNLTLNEDAPVQTVNLTGIGAGAANEIQTLTVTATSSNPGLIPVPTINYISPDTIGSLSFAPAADASGTATITVTVDDGQAQSGSVSRSFTVTVNAVNDPPTLNALNNLSLTENAGPQTVGLTGIGSGAANESQTLTITATSSNPGLIPNPTVSYTSPNGSGSLSFTPVTGASGTATITVTVNDGQAQNNLLTRTFVVGVNAVNDPPTLNPLNNLTLNEDATVQTVNLAGIGSGSASESQTLAVTATSSNPALIPNPSVNYTSPNATGSLTFTPVANANGTATITVTVDDGQAANNSVSRSFTVTVNAVNDSPTLNAVGNLTLNEDAGAQTVNLSGIGSGAANENQTLTVTATSSNPGLIPHPVVSYTSPGSSGALSFTPVADANGNATITITINDGQAQNNSVSRTFTVTVNAVNDPPTLNALADLVMEENASMQTVNLAGISSGAANESQSLIVTATSSNPGLIPHPTVNYTSPNASGSLTFTPVANANGSATVTVTVNDGTAQNNTVVRTFNVAVSSVNQPPTISAITNIIIAANSVSPEIPFTVGDVETEASNLILQASSSNPGLVTQTGIAFGGSGANRTVTLRPLLDREGDSDITITVSDGEATASTTFLLSVLGVPPPPSSLTVVTNGDGSVTGVPAAQTIREGLTYTLTATAGEGQMFVGWTGSTNSLSPTLSIKARTNLMLRANFVPLSLSIVGNGTITPNLKKTRNLVLGRTYTVTAAGGAGSMFTGWSGSTNSASPTLRFVMSSNLVLEASFVPVKVTVNGTGTLSPDPRKTTGLVPGRSYTVRALPGVGQEFAGWSGSLESPLPSVTFVLTTNLNLQANFIPSPYIPIAGTYQGLFYEDTEVRRHTSGYFSVAVTARGTYSGWLQTAFTRHTFTGKLGLDCRGTNVIPRPYFSPLKLALNFGTGSEIDLVNGSVGDTNWTASVFGDRVVFNLRTNPAPYAGNYTVVLPGQSDSALLPAGDGFGTLRVTTSGLTTFTGTMSDGARVLQSSALSKHGYWPMHAVLTYGTVRGAVIGWMTFADRPQDDLNGTLIWTKPANWLDRYYPLGFNTECQAIGSVYRTPVGPQTNYVLNLAQADVAFSGGNLPADFSNSILFGPYSRVSNLSGNPLTLTFSTSLGTFTGSVTDPSTMKPFSFKGAVLQKQNAGFGFLTGTNKTSRVVIQGP